MRSSDGVHLVALDHARALAVFLVFAYHFTISLSGKGAALAGSFGLPVNALIIEGHTGVSLFMTLSGYLFSRLAEGRDIDFTAFRFNRFIRLAPLMGLVLAVNLVQTLSAQPDLALAWLHEVVVGFVLPTWPNGGWSITTELHFYLLFPFLLTLLRRDWRLMFLIPIGGILVRSFIYHHFGSGSLQAAAYWTICGRIDQFALGMAAGAAGGFFAGRHRLAACIGIAWICAWYAFALSGGYYSAGHKWLWTLIPTAEGAVYAALIAYYDRSFSMPARGLSGAIAKIGERSFSIYLLHFFIVAAIAHAIDTTIVRLDNFYVAVLFCLPAFGLMVAAAGVTYRFVEAPFLARRVKYFRIAGAAPAPTVRPATYSPSR